jgi:hypothetical protein
LKHFEEWWRVHPLWIHFVMFWHLGDWWLLYDDVAEHKGERHY